MKRKAALCIADSPREAWDGAIRGWFQKTLPVSWKQARPSLVVVPTRSHAHALKARLLQEGQSNLGIYFVTPAGLREFLSGASEQTLPLREHFRLLLAIAAEETLRESNGDDLAAKAVVRAPDHLLRTLDRLETAGWNFDALRLDSFQPIVRRFREQLRACGFFLLAEFDRKAMKESASQPPIFANLLIYGFDAAHWPYWSLLRTALNAAEDATVLLDYPRGHSNVDLSWIGSWEEAFGEATPVSSPRKNTSDDLFTEAEMRGIDGNQMNCRFVVGANASEQAEAIALLCLQFLAEKKCTAVGVVFGAAGSLSRLVSTALGELNIPHHDALGHLAPGPFEADEWRTWLALQRSPRIGPFLRFFNALTNAAEVFPGLNGRTLEKRLHDAYSELLIDDLQVLREFCASHAEEDGRAIAGAIHSLDLLPSQATLNEFLERTRDACAHLGWKYRWLEIARRIDVWIEKIPAKISRALFLRWLEEITSSFGLERAPRGDHPYARVQLLTVPQACGQEWSYLIFAGWNEGAWPQPPTGEFMREDQIEAFNRQVRQLNRRAARQGRQGEGHESVREGHAHYLGPVEQRAIALRQFDALRESATQGIALTASLIQDSAPERLWNPNELFTRLFQEVRGRPLTEDAMADLRRATMEWVRSATGAKEPATSVKQTGIAYQGRRDPVAQAGEYDFAFRQRSPVVPTLSVSEFEKLLSAPAIVWIRKYLGVKAPEDDASVWNTSTGKWIHDWLAQIAGDSGKSFVRRPDAAEIDRRICSSAQQQRAHVAGLCEAARRPLPDWWESGHRHALFLARTLGEKLAAVDGWPFMASEWKIDEALSVEVEKDASLLFRGRIDLLLARRDVAAGSLATEELWIVDYKTGAKKALASASEDVEKRKAALRKKLLDGTALQLGLYALATQTLGAERTWVALLSPLVRPLTPQLSGEEIAGEHDIFAELARMQQSGQFGMHGLLRSAFRFTEEYPLATLAIDPDILEQRWEKTHPPLVREDEDIFW